MSKFIDLTGKRFGRLIVLERATNDKWGAHRWLCMCDCKNKTIVHKRFLENGKTKSCGCLQRERASAYCSKFKLKHGHSTRTTMSRTYKAWGTIIQRCTNTNNEKYPIYGGRGIIVCKRWRNSFPNFLEDMGESPGIEYSIDRINNNEGYYKENCRWATRQQQMRNKRDNIFVVYKGKTKLVIEWAEEYQISYHTLRSRIYRLGWSIEKALTTPVRKIKKKGKKK